MSSQNRAGKLGMGNGWSPICSETIPPLKGEHTEVKFPSQVETEQSLIIIVVVVVVLLLFHNNNY